MPKFDLQTAGNLAGSIGSGQDLLGALDIEYGIPTCMMNLGRDLLSLLPTNVLGGMRNDMSVGRNAADGVVKSLSQKLRNLTGIIEFDTDEGVFRFVSDSSLYGQESGGLTGSIGKFVGKAQQAIGFGGSLYSNANTAIQGFDRLVDCVSDFGKYLKSVGGESAEERAVAAATDPDTFANMIAEQYGPQIEQAANAQSFIDSVTQTMNDIDSIISERINNPDLEPKFTESEIEEVGSVFRLKAGPPQSKSGQFLLSVDGLYYDSQTSGVAPALLELATRAEERDPSLDWKLEFDPSLGGRGAPATVEDFNGYLNTIFDPNLIDDSSPFPNYYEADNLLQNILGQRDRRMFDVSAEIQQHVDAGSSQAIIDNLKQVMISESARYTSQANRRKKQIELAIKIPQSHGKGILFEPGEVPVNDFSYLAGINYSMNIQRQREIVIRQDEVAGVVLPVETKFSEVIETINNVGFEHLRLSPMPDGLIIDGAAASASTSASLAAVPKIVDDSLFALYNYLTLETSDPSGVDYRLRNSTSSGVAVNAQIVGEASEILDKGVGIVHLKGICRPDVTGGISGAGTYAKLPATQSFQDFMYLKGGASFETWVHTPNLSSTSYYNQTDDVSGLYRLILANENTGSGIAAKPQDDILNMSQDDGAGVCRGMLLGFARDRRFTKTTTPSNLEADNPVEDVCLVLAPTQSFDSSSAGFISEKLITETCQSASSFKGMVIPVSNAYNGTSLSSCASSFCHLSVTLNPLKDQISVYLDGSFLATSSYDAVFGVNPRQRTPMIPSIPPDNSFEYNETNIQSSSLNDFRFGPKRDDYFTPWILGGGYTDGNPDGNFMGGTYGGKVSGLNGYLGCTRFYSKPLSSSEVLNNYNATKNFFKNIKLQ